MIKLHLVFHFWIPNDYMTNKAINVHLKMLAEYANVFDYAYFVISANDVTDFKAIEYIQKKILECHFKKITFSIEQNDEMREGKTFYEKICNNQEYSYSEDIPIVFFGHTKGVTNVNNSEYQEENIVRWITGMYFLNLEPKVIDNLKWTVLSAFPDVYCYGAYLSKGQHNDRYDGSFYWINAKRFIEKKIKLTQSYYDSYFTELVPSLCGDIDNNNLLSYNHLYLTGAQGLLYYNDIKWATDFLMDDLDKNKYNNFILNICKVD